MKSEFPAAVPEIPLTDMNAALDYYQAKLGFSVDWGGADGGIAGISKATAECSSQTLVSASTMVTHRQS